MQNSDVDAGTEETVWQYGGIYTYLTAATELFVSCSDVADTGQTMQITGLKSPTSKNVDTELSYSTNGRTAVSIGTWYRIFGIRVLLPTALLGSLYCATSDTLTAGVPNTPSKVKLAILYNATAGRSPNTANHAGFTPPPEFFAVIRSIRFSGTKGKAITYNTLIRPNDGTTIRPWQDAAPWRVFENNEILDFSGVIVDSLWDIEIRTTSDSANTEITVIMDILLIRKD